MFRNKDKSKQPPVPDDEPDVPAGGGDADADLYPPLEGGEETSANVQALTAELEEANNKWKRALADFQNYQRRAIEKNDLPQVQAELAAYLQALRSKSSIESILSLTSTAQIVPKEKIAANGDYNLSGERYRQRGPQTGRFPWHKLESLIETLTPQELRDLFAWLQKNP